MCIASVNATREGLTDKNPEWLWRCCRCDWCDWTLALHPACLHCGHWRCSNLTIEETSKMALAPKCQDEDQSLPAKLGTREIQNLEELVGHTHFDHGKLFSTADTGTGLDASRTPSLISLNVNMDKSNPASDVIVTGFKSGREEPIGTKPDAMGMSRAEMTKTETSPSQIGPELAVPVIDEVAQLGEIEAGTAMSPWLEERPAHENDSIGSTTYTPTELGGSPSTQSYNSESAMITPDITESVQSLENEFDESSSSNSETIRTSSPEDMTQTVEDLLNQPWFQRDLRRTLRTVLQRWQGLRTWAQDPSTVQPDGTSQHMPSSSSQQSSRSKSKRNHQRHWKDDPSQDDQRTTLKRRKTSKESRDPRGFACPFCKKDLQQYQSCAKYRFKKVRYVKQHIIHRSPHHELDVTTEGRLKQRSTRGTEEEQWYEIFDTLFPGYSPRPASPYNDFTVSENPSSGSQISHGGGLLDNAVYIYLINDGADVLQRALLEDPALSHLSENTLRSAAGRGLSRLVSTFVNRSLREFGEVTQIQISDLQANNPENHTSADGDGVPPSHTPRPIDGEYEPDVNPGAESEVIEDQGTSTTAHSSLTTPLASHWNLAGPDHLPHQEIPQNSQDVSVVDEWLGGQETDAGGTLQQIDEPALALSATLNESSQASPLDEIADIDWIFDPHFGDYEH